MDKKTDSDFSDLLKLGETALSALLGAAKEVHAHSGAGKDTLIRKLDLVTREEFDAAFDMIKKARAIQGDLEKRVTALEKQISKSSTTKQLAKKRLAKRK
jgi:BMFP domain-containing protein YqiC